MTWAGVVGKYFTIIAVPPGDQARLVLDSRVIVPGTVRSALAFSRPSLRAARTEDVWRFYLGPMKTEVLERYDAADENGFGIRDLRLHESIDKPWALLRPIIWLMRLLMELFVKVIPNWGVSIILVTLVTKIVFLPLTFKSSDSMARMASLNPKIAELRAKYKDKPERMNQEMAALYKKEKVNPLSGCLPLLLQIPIFFSLYNLFNSHFELRGAMFIPGWIPDLSVAESVYDLPFSLLGIDAIRLLPLIMLAHAVPVEQAHAAAVVRRVRLADETAELRDAGRVPVHAVQHALGAHAVLDRPEPPLHRPAGLYQPDAEEEGHDPGAGVARRRRRNTMSTIVKEFEGRNEKEAIDRAIEELGLDRSEIDFEIVESKKPGILRGGKVKIRVHVSEEEVEAAVQDGRLSSARPIEAHPPMRRPPRGPSGGPVERHRRRGPERPDRPAPVRPAPVHADEVPEENLDQDAAEAALEAAVLRGEPRGESMVARTPRPAASGAAMPHEAEIVDFVRTLLGHMGFKAQVVVGSREPNRLGIDVETDKSAVLIGKQGKTLEAFQFICNLAAARLGAEGTRVIIDTQDYRSRREHSLERMAAQAADRVRRNRESVLLEPLNPFERRIVHTAIARRGDVETESEGDGLYKRIRVSLKGGGNGGPRREGGSNGGRRGRGRGEERDRDDGRT